MTVYFRSARGGSGREVTDRGPPLPAVVHSELARRSSIDSMACSFVGDGLAADGRRTGGQRAGVSGQLALGHLAPRRAGKLRQHDQMLGIVLLRGPLSGQEVDELVEGQVLPWAE